MVSYAHDFRRVLTAQSNVPHIDTLLEELPNLVLDQDGSVAIPTSKALHIYSVRYEIKRDIRKRTDLGDYEYLLEHLASYPGEQVRIAFLHNPNSGYLLFIGESPVMLLGILHSKKTMEKDHEECGD